MQQATKTRGVSVLVNTRMNTTIFSTRISKNVNLIHRFIWVSGNYYNYVKYLRISFVWKRSSHIFTEFEIPRLSCFLCLTTPSFCLISPLKQSYRASYSGAHEAKVHSIITSLKYGKLRSLYLSCQCQLSLSQPVWYFPIFVLFFLF